MTFRTEFPDFNPETMPVIPPAWTDESWHNDVCPSFRTPNGLRVWVDYADPDMRESASSEARFNVVDDQHPGDASDNVVLESDDWSAVLAFVADPDAWEQGE